MPGQVFRLFALDAGKRRSHFGALYAQLMPHPVNEIRILGAKEYAFDYTIVEQDVLNLHAKHKFHEIIIERNNTGDHVIDSLRYMYRQRRTVGTLPIFELTTTGTLPKEPEEHPELMHKTTTAEYVKELKDKGVIKTPKELTPALKRLEEQMGNFLPHYSQAGNRTYYADGEERDDLVMCMLFICHRARPYLGKNFQPKAASWGADNDYWASLKAEGKDSRKERILSQPRIRDRIKELGVNVKDVRID